MQFNDQQTAALAAIESWHRHWMHERADTKDTFLLTGFAGTGKTTLAREIAERVRGNVLFAAYTGKAAHVLQQKGCAGAQTIHSLIYQPQEKSTQHLKEMERAVEAAWEAAGRLTAGQDPEHASALRSATRLERELEDERERVKQPGFKLNTASPLRDADLLILDEVSMVGERVGRDLESFEVPILAMGDRAQLPPVKDGAYFTGRQPDFELTQVHRQSTGSPIIALATDVRQGRFLDYGDHVVRKGEVSIGQALAADQIIVGRNATRHSINAQARKHLGRMQAMPCIGDKVICTRNDNEEGLLNGSMWRVTNTQPDPDDADQLLLGIVNEEQRLLQVTAHAQPFLGQTVPLWKLRDAQQFEYGYAITCHKAQGSQWPHVIVYDESAIARGDAGRWLYTAITRASERVTIIR